MKLYELAESYHRIEALFEEEGADWQKALDEIAEAFDTKAENIAKMVRQCEAEAKVLNDEAKRLSEKALASSNRARHLKDYLKANMLATGIDKIKGQIINIFLQNNPPSCQIIDESQIPEVYMLVIPETKQPDKRAIIDAFKSGIDVPGVEIATEEKHILIK